MISYERDSLACFFALLAVESVGGGSNKKAPATATHREVEAISQSSYLSDGSLGELHRPVEHVLCSLLFI